MIDWDSCVLWLDSKVFSESYWWDISPYRNNGDVYGAVWKGNGFYFDGINDKVLCGSNQSLQISDAISVEAWIEVGEDDSYLGIISRNFWSGWLVRREGNNKLMVRLKFADGTNSGEIEGGSITVNKGICQCVFTYDKDNDDVIRLYINGEEVKVSDSMNNKAIKTGGITCIGLVDVDYFKGKIFRVRIFRKLLTRSEIQILYDSEYRKV